MASIATAYLHQSNTTRRTPRIQGDPAPATREVLEGADADISAALVQVALDPPTGLAGLPLEELKHHLRWIGGACVSGEADAAANGAVMILRRQLLACVRTAVINQWSRTPPDSPVMLETLQRLQRAEEACVPSQDQSFAAELADRGGLDLLVEVVHDMRSPLTSILFLSEVLHRGQSGGLSDLQRRQVGIVYSAALGLVGMVSDTIEMARGGRRLNSQDPRPFSVNETIQAVRDLVSPIAEQKQLSLVIESLPADRRLGHPIPLSRVLLNLATNALKFTQSGSVTVSAKELGGARVLFSVSDTGPGIPRDVVDSLYQPFRAEPKRESGYYFSGTGLGLAISRRLVEAMNGTLIVESEANRGTSFSFELELPPASLL
jgi:signal transduction histidine kinase